MDGVWMLLGGSAATCIAADPPHPETDQASSSGCLAGCRTWKASAMNDRLHANMLEAARFTQAGRLTEATAFLQRLLGGEAEPEPAAADTGPAPAGRAPQIIDVVQETIEATAHQPAAITVPAFGAGARGRSTGGMAGPAQPPLPEALRSFLERLNGSGLEAGLGGLAGLAKGFPAPAPELVPDGARFVAGSYSNQAGSRGYKLYVP